MLPGLATMPLGSGLIGGARAAGAAASAVPRAAGWAGAAEQLGIGTGLSVLSSQEGDLAGAAAGGLGWGLAGSLAGNMVSRVSAGRAAAREARQAQQAAAMSGALHEGQREILEGAQRSGMHVTPGQATGSDQARLLEAALSSNPMTSEVFQEMERANKSQLNTLAARAMGVEADNVGPAVRAQAEHAIGRDFQAVGEALGPVPTAKLHKDLVALAQKEAVGGLPTREALKIQTRFESGAKARLGAVGDKADDAVDLAKDVMHGPELIEMRSEVAGEMRAAFANSKPRQGKALGDVLEAIDGAIERAAVAAGKPEVVGRYDVARERWNVLRAIDRRGSTPDGELLAGTAATNIGKGDRGGYWGRADEFGETTQRTGTGNLGQDAIGDLYDALRWRNSQLGKPIVGDTGSGTRSFIGQVMAGGGLPALAGKAVQSVATNPAVRAYANMSPEAAARILAMKAAMQGTRGSAGTRAGAFVGGRAPGAAGSAWDAWGADKWGQE
jgi:hypothetical protein